VQKNFQKPGTLYTGEFHHPPSQAQKKGGHDDCSLSLSSLYSLLNTLPTFTFKLIDHFFVMS
jgi:hypothetical protein